jgi:drug/metabolite transporter (DMT)-like permease
MSPRPPTTSENQLDWTLFLLLSFMWGSSYLFIRIGVNEGLQPLTLIMLRLLFGALLLVGVFLVTRPARPDKRRTYGHLLVMSLLSIVIPFWLITYGEGSGVDSSVASILNSTVPLFTIVIAPLFLPDEAVTVNRVVGLAVGFVGVIVLASGDLSGTGSGITFGVVALLLSAVSYAAGAVYARRNARGLSPITTAFFQVIFAFTIVTVLAFTIENPLAASITPAAAFSVVWLGLFGSGMAYLLFFRLLGRWGPTRTSLVAYLLPVWGIVLGAAVLEEPVDARLLLGTALVVGGVALVNARYGTRRLFSRSAPAVDEAA